MSVRGFWSKVNARNRADWSRYSRVPSAPPGRVDPQLAPEGTWTEHPDREAVAKATVAQCYRQEVKT
jgi:hypothetical protein